MTFTDGLTLMAIITLIALLLAMATVQFWDK